MTVHVALADVAAPRGLVGGPFGSSLVGKDYVDEGVPIIRGSNLGSGKWVGGEFAFVTREKFERDLARNAAVPGDLVFTQRGTLGQVSLVPAGLADEFVVSQSQMRLRVDTDRYDPHYVYYACEDPGFIRVLSDRAIRTGVPHINLGILAELTIPSRAIDEQRAIAEVLGALDDKIAANDRLERTTSELIASRASAVMRAATADAPLMDVLDVEFGEAFKGDRFTEPGIGRPLIRIRDLKTFRSQIWTTESRERESEALKGDVLVGMDAEFRATWWLGEPGLVNQRVCRISSKQAGRALVRELLEAPLARIERSKTGTTVIHLNKSDMLRETVRWPDEDARRSTDRELEPLLDVRVQLASERTTLAQLRDTLLPALMSGRLSVSRATDTVEPATGDGTPAALTDLPSR